MAATSDIGKHIGAEVKNWATVLLLGVAGLVAIPVLAKRDVNGGVVLALLVVLVGGFAFAPDSVKHAIESLWKSIAG
jgi:xanthine/uracil/vitamin C permease (AzgA family)